MGIKDMVRKLVRRKTPIPMDKEVYNLGIQEQGTPNHFAGPMLYDVAKNSTIVRTCLVQLKTEIFRRGYEWEKAFYSICKNCKTKQQNPTEECTECGSTKLSKPNRAQKNYAERFLTGSVNETGQLIVDLLKEMENDLNIMDDAYMVVVKEYYVDNLGNIVMHKVKELYRADPVTTYIETDEDGDRGHSRYTCISHREAISDDCHSKCEFCNAQLVPVQFTSKVFGKEQYYIEGEVIHISKWTPSRLYGFPPILTLWNNITTLMAMESYVNTSYTKSRTPKGILAVQTNNMESLVRYWKGVKEKLEKDPHYIPIMGIETDGGNRGSVEWVPFMQSLKEMEYTSVKDDLRMRISAFFGVSNIFLADSSTGGGLNNEGMQIMVTNRSIEMAQSVYNRYLFPFLMKQFGVTDWKIALLRSEEEDEMAVIRKRELEINLAIQMKNLGFDIEMDAEGNFIYKKKEEAAVKEPGQEEQIEVDPYAGTDIDASQLGQLQAESLTSGKGPAPVPTPPEKKRNKPSMSVGPDKRFTGLPKEAGNQNVDRRTERRIPK